MTTARETHQFEFYYQANDFLRNLGWPKSAIAADKNGWTVYIF
jgi:hypothetical protein